jgi:hypothetical protein
LQKAQGEDMDSGSQGTVALIDDARFAEAENGISSGALVFGSEKADKYLIIPPSSIVPLRMVLDSIRNGDSQSAISNSLVQKGYELDLSKFYDLLYYKRLLLRDGKAFDGRSDDPLSRTQSDALAVSRDIRACKEFCVNGYTTPRSEYGHYQGNPG